jgi:hypothetical protein
VEVLKSSGRKSALRKRLENACCGGQQFFLRGLQSKLAELQNNWLKKVAVFYSNSDLPKSATKEDLTVNRAGAHSLNNTALNLT